MRNENDIAISAADIDKERFAQLDLDINRIKRDIAETAARHGCDELTFSLDWVEYSNPSPDVKVSCTLF